MNTGKPTRTRSSRLVVLEHEPYEPGPNKLYSCPVNVSRREDGYLAVAAQLPGVAGFGKTLDEAMADVVKAFKIAIPKHLRERGKIPWFEVPVEPEFGVVVRLPLIEITPDDLLR